MAIEGKLIEQVQQQDLKGLMAFDEEHPNAKAIVVSGDKRPRLLRLNDALTMALLPWRIFINTLSEGC